MSAARTNPQILDEVQGVVHVPQVGMILPMLSFTKSEIESRVDTFLNDALEDHDARDVFVLLKQMEEAVKVAIEKTKTVAFDSFALSFAGETSGQVLGHEVKLSYPKKWIYTEAILALAEKQKAELKAAQLLEQASGTAKQETELGRITVTLKSGKEGK